MDRTAIPRQNAEYKFSELEGEGMLYHTPGGTALYLNETAMLIWKLCDGVRTVETIEQLLAGAFPDAADLPNEMAAAFRVLIEHGAVDVR